jgi:hypothetical protein
MIKKFLSPNIDTRGRLVRGITAMLLLLAAIILIPYVRRLALALALLGLFVLFEASSGWCALRACGIKTKF